MFAVVQFSGGRREYAIVPLSWLINDHKDCYWPKVKTPEVFKKLIQSSTLPEPEWPKHSLRRLIKIFGN